MNRYSRHQADLDDFPDDLVADNQLRYAAMMSTMSGPQQALAYLIACETQANQALETAENQLRHNNINAATGAVECAHTHVAAARAILERGQTTTDEQEDQQAQRELVDHDHSIAEMEHTIEEKIKTIASRSSYQNFDENTTAWYASRMQPRLSLQAVQKMSRWILNPDQEEKRPAEFQSACMKVISELHEWPNLMRQHPDPENILKKPDGFTRHKARVDEQALQAEREIATIAQDAAAVYNKTIPVVVSPRLTPFSEATSAIAAMTLMSNHSHVSIICLCENEDEARELPPCTAYVAFIHDGRKHILAVGDPYPSGFPADAATHHMENLLSQMEREQPFNCNRADELYMQARAMITAADLEIHTVASKAIDKVLGIAKDIGLPRGGLQLVLETIADYDLTLAQLLTTNGAHQGAAVPRMCGRRQARTIIETARQQGLDPYQLAELAETLGFTARQVNAKPKLIPSGQRTRLSKAGLEAGLSPDIVERVMEALDDLQE